MSTANVVTVQLGQCGNQVGSQLFTTLADEAAQAESVTLPEAFFRESDGTSKHKRPIARAALIDMEPKVINAALRAASRSGGFWEYSKASAFSFESGSGNNWARGYNVLGPRFAEDISEVVRREVEACDRLGGFLLLQSMAGGTGSGVGAFAAEALRDLYPSSFIASHCVWPYESGEVIVQSYNTLLTLAALVDAADAVVLVHNQVLHLTATKLLGIPRPSFGDLNEIASRALASVLLPARWRAAGAGGEPGRPVELLGDVAARLCPHPSLRLLSLYSVPQIPAKSVDFTTFTWPGMLKRLRQMAITGFSLEEGLDWSVSVDGTDRPRPNARPPMRSVATGLWLHGKGAADADVSPFLSPGMYADWPVEPLSVAFRPAPLNRYEIAASVLSNSAAAAEAPRAMLPRAYGMFASRAYVHQYAAHGIGGDFIEAALARVEDVGAAYGALCSI